MLSDGTLAKTPLEGRKRWLQFFAEEVYTDSHITTMEKHIDQIRQDHRELISTEWFQGIQLEGKIIPTHSDFEKHYLKSKNGKAFGEDGIPIELVKLAISEFAHHMVPIGTKAALRFEEPIQWRGGVMNELYKKNGSRAVCANSRGILLSDNSSKNYHKTVRGHLDGPMNSCIQETQVGGIAGRGAPLSC